MKKKLIVLMVVGLIVGAAPVAPVDAATSGFHFVCTTDLPEWPTSVNTAPPCTGTSYGHVAGSPCPTGCQFSMTIDEYSDTCVGTEPPFVGTASGSMYSGSVYIGSYDFVRVGTSITFFVRGTNVMMGEGTWIPSIPLGTCAAPARNFHVTISGTIGTP